jgi:hypothetical protein
MAKTIDPTKKPLFQHSLSLFDSAQNAQVLCNRQKAALTKSKQHQTPKQRFHH